MAIDTISLQENGSAGADSTPDTGSTYSFTTDRLVVMVTLAYDNATGGVQPTITGGGTGSWTSGPTQNATDGGSFSADLSYSYKIGQGGTASLVTMDYTGGTTPVESLWCLVEIATINTTGTMVQEVSATGNSGTAQSSLTTPFANAANGVLQCVGVYNSGSPPTITMADYTTATHNTGTDLSLLVGIRDAEDGTPNATFTSNYWADLAAQLAGVAGGGTALPLVNAQMLTTR